jgi:exodeoxyribonuclease VII small subunit
MTRKKNEAAEAPAQAPAFEQALERLETIVGEMEGGALSLEDMMARFEEGQALVKVCSEKLNQVERRIEILMKEGDKVVAKPFAEMAPETPETAADEDEEETTGGGGAAPGNLPF